MKIRCFSSFVKIWDGLSNNFFYLFNFIQPSPSTSLNTTPVNVMILLPKPCTCVNTLQYLLTPSNFIFLLLPTILKLLLGCSNFFGTNYNLFKHTNFFLFLSSNSKKFLTTRTQKDQILQQSNSCERWQKMPWKKCPEDIGLCTMSWWVTDLLVTKLWLTDFGRNHFIKNNIHLISYQNLPCEWKNLIGWKKLDAFIYISLVT